ncbi:hypothetical protein [Flavobacterium sp. H122]|uniref:hypothetical protein n=1 Tax=Flavobacterium sp. H122 TaxID=2529860 RepID=UPI0010AB4AC0|nr:hypothetical protein [Flavobacterium sp. H122]
MKKNLIKTVLTLVLITAFTACEKSELKQENPKDQKTAVQALAPCAPVYALVLSGSSSSPVPAGFASTIFKVDLCAAPTGYNFVSQINVAGVPVRSVTGLCNMPGVVDFAWAVTGMNSNFPSKLLRVQISTGSASVVATTTVPLQDIENYGTTGLFVAIKEGTSQLMKVSVPSGFCSVFAPAGPTPQYNGLTVVGNKFHAISGTTNLICNPTYGDIFEYTTAGGPYVGKYSYKNLTTTPSWTMKELGFHFDACCGKRWTVGSSMGIISHNTNITPCVLPNPTFLLNTTTTGQNYWYIYDFMEKL